jgi:hypothetical protein
VRGESEDALMRAGRLIELQQRYRQAATDMGTANGGLLVDLICENPIVITRLVETASASVGRPRCGCWAASSSGAWSAWCSRAGGVSLGTWRASLWLR